MAEYFSTCLLCLRFQTFHGPDFCWPNHCTVIFTLFRYLSLCILMTISSRVIEVTSAIANLWGTLHPFVGFSIPLSLCNNQSHALYFLCYDYLECFCFPTWTLKEVYVVIIDVLFIFFFNFTYSTNFSSSIKSFLNSVPN